MTDNQPPRWWQRIGPALITACVVIGPGSILTSSKVGSAHGYGMSWVVLVAVLFMLVYMYLGAKLGVVASKSSGDLVTEKAGRWLAVLIGLSVFFIASAFQFGNNLGVHAAFELYFDFEYTIVIFNLLSILFLFLFKNVYQALEKMMMVFVGLMLIAFVINLIAAEPDVIEWIKGLIGLGMSPDKEGLAVEVVGLIGTTFVTAAAYYQSYLVQQKGWRREQLKSGMIDTRVGAIVMAAITLMIMATAASFLRGEKLEDVKVVATQLNPLFGGAGQLIFCLGLFSAAYSSFIVNSMVGGFVLSDGLGLGSKPTQLAPKILTTVVLLTGMVVAMIMVRTGAKPVGAIVAAQAVTVLAAPLMVGVLLWLTNRKDVMGDDRNSLWLNVVASLGLVMSLIIAGHTAIYKVWPAITE